MMSKVRRNKVSVNVGRFGSGRQPKPTFGSSSTCGATTASAISHCISAGTYLVL